MNNDKQVFCFQLPRIFYTFVQRKLFCENVLSLLSSLINLLYPEIEFHPTKFFKEKWNVQKFLSCSTLIAFIVIFVNRIQLSSRGYKKNRCTWTALLSIWRSLLKKVSHGTGQ